MWFETEDEYKPRLRKALEAYRIQEAGRIKVEEEQAWERKRIA